MFFLNTKNVCVRVYIYIYIYIYMCVCVCVCVCVCLTFIVQHNVFYFKTNFSNVIKCYTNTPALQTTMFVMRIVTMETVILVVKRDSLDVSTST